MIYDPRAASEIIGCLLKDNSLLAKADDYVIHPSDFQDRLHKIIFNSIFNLYYNGASGINALTIEEYLSGYPDLYAHYKKEKGTDFLLTALDIAELNNFDYYYGKFKKYSLLNSLQSNGFDVSEWYSTDLLNFTLRQETHDRLEKANIQDIIHSIQKKISSVQADFLNKSDNVVALASDGLRELKERLKAQPEFGMNLEGDILNTITRGARRTKYYIYSASTGGGKALPNDTVIPTPDGWKQVDEIKIGDYLFDRKGKPTKVIGVFPQGNKEVYQLTFSDGRQAKCCKEHLWSFWNSTLTSLKTMSLEQIMASGLLKTSNGWEYKVPVNQAVEYNKQDLPIDPYVLGIMLGDGSFREQSRSKSITLSSENDELPQVVADIMGWTVIKNSEFNFGYSFRDTKGDRVYVSHFLEKTPELINTYSHNKFIPKKYLVGSIEQRYDLLNGLLDTDGSVDKKGRIGFSTTSQQLKDDFVCLARSLGFIPTLQTVRPVDDRHKHELYTISLQGSPELKKNLFRLNRKKETLNEYLNSSIRKEKKKHIGLVDIQSLNYLTPMTCFAVDNEEHLFLMNDYIVTHNTRTAVGNACKLAYPYYYSEEKKSWIINGDIRKSLFISTELTNDEVQTLILAYLSGVNEEIILNGTYKDDEEKRVDEAINIAELYKDNFHIFHLPDPSVKQLESNIRKLVLENSIDCVFYDYIHTSPALLAEFMGARIREDKQKMSFNTFFPLISGVI